MGQPSSPATARGGSHGAALVAAMAACAIWGVSAVAAQVIFSVYSLSPLVLVAIRMPVSGLILLALFRPRRPRASLRRYIVFSVIGLWLVQYTYFLTIASSNAATATLLQFLSLPMIAAYEAVFSKTRTTLGESSPWPLPRQGRLSS